MNIAKTPDLNRACVQIDVCILSGHLINFLSPLPVGGSPYVCLSYSMYVSVVAPKILIGSERSMCKVDVKNFRY